MKIKDFKFPEIRCRCDGTIDWSKFGKVYPNPKYTFKQWVEKYLKKSNITNLDDIVEDFKKLSELNTTFRDFDSLTFFFEDNKENMDFFKTKMIFSDVLYNGKKRVVKDIVQEQNPYIPDNIMLKIQFY